MKFAVPRGTRDFLPGEMAGRRRAEAAIREEFERWGYAEVQTPVFESLELITAKSGDEIREHLYHFKDKSGRDLALRPELTAPVVRLYINGLKFKPKPVKLYYLGNCFRYERPQAGRYREFSQAGVELIGTDKPEAEAEIMALAHRVMGRLGLEFEMHVGHIGVLREVLADSGVSEKDQNVLMGLIDKGDAEKAGGMLDSLGVEKGRKETLLRLIQMKGKRKKVMEEALELVGSVEAARLDLERLEETLDMLEAFGVNDCSLNLGIARGLDYYTGTVFEAYARGLGAQDQVCGGGSYSLIKALGGEDTPSCGFAFGFDRLLLALEKQGKGQAPDGGTKVFVVPSSERLLKEAVKVSNRIGEKVPCEVDLCRRKLGKALGYADSTGASHVVIVGESEFEKGKVTIRDMKTGEQKVIELKNILEMW